MNLVDNDNRTVDSTVRSLNLFPRLPYSEVKKLAATDLPP